MPRLHAYIATLINSHGHKSIIVGGVEDYVHILLRYNVNQLSPKKRWNVENHPFGCSVHKRQTLILQVNSDRYK
jgi:hypothetical protein